MKRAIHGAPASTLWQALEALAQLSFWISWTSDPDLAPEAADRADPPPNNARRASAPVSGTAPDDSSGGGAGQRAADARDPQQQQPEAEPGPGRAGAGRPEGPPRAAVLQPWRYA